MSNRNTGACHVARKDDPLSRHGDAGRLAALEQNPYNNIDGVPTFGAFARTESR
jgi:hypothetical protein